MAANRAQKKLAKEEKEAKKAAKAASKDEKSSDDSLIDDIIGGKPIVSPPDKPKGGTKPGEDTPTGPQAPLPAFPPSLWMMLGAMLNKVLKTKAYELDKECAQYLSDSMTLMLQEQNVKMSPTYAFIIAIGMWLGLGTVQMMIEKSGDPKTDKTPKVGDVKQWFQRNKVDVKTADFVAETPISPQVETVEVPIAEERRNLQQPIPIPAEAMQKVKPIDLKAMEALSRKEMKKVEMELKKKESRPSGAAPSQ
jgi:hypothetical protein